MNPKTSIYLDLLRFSAAMVVFISHASNPPITGGLLWQFYPYAQTAVMIFFVLSGYVIGYVVNTRERNITAYWSSRVARMYSVALPALVLTLICDGIGLNLDREYYTSYLPTVETNEIPNYLLSIFFLQNIWDLNLNPGTNGPFWSLSYEVLYYILFGVFFFLSGIKKYLSTIFFAILAGPQIITLFPIWLLGYVIYNVHKCERPQTRPYVYSLLSLACMILLVSFGPWVRANLVTDVAFVREEIVADYFDAILFSLHILWIPNLLIYVKFNNYFVSIIRWLSSLTFVIYLFHYPAIKLISVIGPEDANSLPRWLVIYGGAFFIIVIATPLTDKLKRYIKRCLYKHMGLSKLKK